jgi:acetolactate synthase-1/2/3 large subunit
MAAPALNGGDALARCIAAAGVRELYGVPAGKLAPFLRAVAATPERLRWIGTRHESTAAWMAGATFAATGRLAVCCGESGPGSHNLVGGLGSAYNNSIPVLAIVSGTPTHLAYPFAGLAMETDNERLFAACTKWRAVAREPSRIAELVQRAVREALSGRPGPVVLEVPADVLAAAADLPDAVIDLAPEHYCAENGPSAAPELIERAAALLSHAERPLVVAGGGVVASGATAELRSVVERLGAAATATQMGLGVISTASPWFFGHGGLVGGEAVVRAAREADVVLAVGTRFSSWWWEGSAPVVKGWPEQELIQIDVDPGVIGRAAPISVGIQADAKKALSQLLTALDDTGPREASPWLGSLRADYERYRDALRALASGPGEPMHPAALARELGDALADDALAVYDGGHTTFWSNDLTPATAPRTRFHEPGMAHLGFGIPYALALAAEFPDRAVVNITGDGAFGFTVAELDTARRYGLNAVHVIHNNAAWGVIRLGQSHQDFELGTDLGGTDYAAIARAFGCHGERIEQPEQVHPALERALASGLPAVIDAQVGFEAHPGMRRFAAAGRR